jgi:hypothetical protein
VAEHRRTNARRLSQQIRGDLDWIVMKCLEKDRNRRYESAGSLAEDVRRFLAGEPIQARPKSLYYRASRFVSRNRLPVASGLAVAVALVVGTIGTTVGLIRASSAVRSLEGEQLKTTAALDRAESARTLAERNLQTARRNAYAADISRAFQVLRESNDVGQIRKLLDQYRPQHDGDEDLRGWEWRYLWQFLQSDATSIIAHYATPPVAMDVTEDGRFLFVSHRDACELWDLRQHIRCKTWSYTRFTWPSQEVDFKRIHSVGRDETAVRVSDTAIVKVNPRSLEEVLVFDSGGGDLVRFFRPDDGLFHRCRSRRCQLQRLGPDRRHLQPCESHQRQFIRVESHWRRLCRCARARGPLRQIFV